ncbi:PASTA domain-containing protein [Haloechinothrix sp. LS1_15]|nr:PASTA domain-containing protein [Haloechinothrix sp. LS1_15]
MPDVVGLDAEEACAIVRAAGLVPYGPEYAPAPTSGTVIGQAPIATAGAERGAAVFLWAGRGGHAEEVPPSPKDANKTLEPA